MMCNWLHRNRTSVNDDFNMQSVGAIEIVLPVYDHITGIHLCSNVAGMFYVDCILLHTSMKDGMEMMKFKLKFIS